MASNTTSNLRHLLFGRLLGVRPEEYVPVAWSFAYFFCVLSSYYFLRPIRETMAVGSGANTVPNLFTATFVLMMIAVPIFGWFASRYPRRVMLPWVYAFFISNVLVFWYLFAMFDEGTTDQIWLGRAFFVWLSVFNLFVVSVFWSFMADIYTREQGRRLFGLITAGGSIGAMIGGLIAKEFTIKIGFENLFPIVAGLLCAAIFCIFRLRVWARRKQVDHTSTDDVEKPLGGNPFNGVAHVFASKYFLGIVASSILASLLGTALYMFAAQLVEESIDGTNARVEFFSSINFWTNFFAFLGQLLLVRIVVVRFGVGRALALLPIVSIVGFVILASDPVLGVVAILTIVRRALGFSFSKPTSDMLYSVVSPEDKYKTKNFIDTAVYRFGDIVGSRTIELMLWSGISWVSIIMLPFAAIWTFISLWLGRDYKRQALTLKRKGIE